MQRHRAGTAARLGAVLLAVATLAGCGGYGYVEGYDPGYPYEEPYLYEYGVVEVDNLTDTTTFEDVYGFFLAPAATAAFTGNLLLGPLSPGFAADVGDFLTDAYDGEADLEFGDLVTWFDVPVPAEAVTTFEVY